MELHYSNGLSPRVLSPRVLAIVNVGDPGMCDVDVKK